MSNAEDSRLTRQQIYDRIRATSKQEYILSEMVRLGFWPDSQDAPTLSEQLILREGELTSELTELLEKQRKYANREQMFKEMRKKRLEESRQKQAETKERRQRERDERARRWKELKAQDIGYLGDGVSGGLQNKESSAERLAQTMGISVGELRFLTFQRDVSKVSHYKRFYMPKKSGGMRLISAPMPRLKAAQYWVLKHLLQTVPLHPAARGFRSGESIVTNAAPHVGSDVVVNLDVKDFFPTVSYPRVKGVFRGLGYSEQLATIFALLCTEPDVDALELDGEIYYVAASGRHLPQGAPTSPALTNILCRRLDSRLSGMAQKMDFAYTRYADDMTFSGNHDALQNLTKLLWRAKKIISDEGFVVHPDKLRIMRSGSRQEVTGIVVNEQMTLERRTLRNFRALLFQIEKDGLRGKTWKGRELTPASLRGVAHYIAMVNPEKGRPLLERVNALLRPV